MAAPNSKQSIIDYAFRRLGAPVIEINVDQEQAEERVSDALQFFSERHFDGVERVYFKYEIPQDEKENDFYVVFDHFFFYYILLTPLEFFLEVLTFWSSPLILTPKNESFFAKKCHFWPFFGFFFGSIFAKIVLDPRMWQSR